MKLRAYILMLLVPSKDRCRTVDLPERPSGLVFYVLEAAAPHFGQGAAVVSCVAVEEGASDTWKIGAVEPSIES